MRPYILGIIDTLIGAEVIRKSNIPIKNRLGVILLDSAFETACRTFLLYIEKIDLDNNHTRRENLIKTVKDKMKDIDEEVWNTIDYYYTEIRCDFYHASAGKTIPDNAYFEYKEIVEFIIDRAFGIKTNQLVIDELIKLETQNAIEAVTDDIDIDISSVKDKVDKVILGVYSIAPRNNEQLNSFFKKEGEKLRLTDKDFMNIVARNNGSRKYFYNDKENKCWALTKQGKKQLDKLKTK